MLNLFFVDNLEELRLLDENAHHADRVLRLKKGEELLISDGAGSWARCRIEDISKREVILNAVERGFENPDELKVSVLQALPKGDRARETVELLTASGVHQIFPWQASRSIGKECEKWQSAAIEASKQSRRFFIPKVSEKLDLKDAIEICKNFEQILICHESADQKLSEIVKRAKSTLVIIGPEGGISEDEVVTFQRAGGSTIKLGRPILRSAHAGIAAVSAVSALMKVW